jgi:hypothetical protein
MTWFKVDDGLADHRKVRQLGRDRLPAMGLWALSGSWAARELTDGFVPEEIVQRHDPKHRYARRLVDVGLWEHAKQDGEDGYQFHDWVDMQPTKVEVLAVRAGNARRAALHRDPELTAAVRDRDANRCRYCAVLVNWKDRRSGQGGTYDHVDPAGDNSFGNVVVACRACNSAKGSRTPDQAGMTLLPPGTGPAGPGPGKSSRSTPDLPAFQNGSGSVSERITTPSRPDPTRPYSNGDLGGGAAVPNAHERPRPHDPPCEKPCHVCRDARLAAERAAEAAANRKTDEQAERARRRKECGSCDDFGWVLGPEGRPAEPARRCKHIRLVSQGATA